MCGARNLTRPRPLAKVRQGCFADARFGDESPTERPESQTPNGSPLKDRIRIKAYPVQELGGMIWAYLGKIPAPLLPRFDFLVRENCERDVGISRRPCNWLQVTENNMDTLHVEYLHMLYTNYVHRRKGLPLITPRKRAKIDFEVFEYGIIKRRLWEGDSEDSEEWTVGHPVLFPGTAVVPYNDKGWVQAQIRVRASDTVWEDPWTDSAGNYTPELLNAQDMMVMVTQGEITDGRRESGHVRSRRRLVPADAAPAAGADRAG